MKTGVIEGFYDSEDYIDEPIPELKDNPTYQWLIAQPRSPNIGELFLRMPTDIVPSEPLRTVYVVYEVRSAYGRTKRRALGVFESKREADRKANAVRELLVSFVERYRGRRIGDEMHDGTMFQYWVTGNPSAIVGFAVSVEESELQAIGDMSEWTRGRLVVGAEGHLS